MPHRAMLTVIALLVLLPGPTASAQVRAGDPAPPITLESISNAPEGLGSVSWEKYADRVVLLEFWGTWCGPCVAAIPHLNDVAEALEGNDSVAFLSVTFEDSDVIGPFLKKRPMRAVVGHDTDKSMPKAFGVTSWPTTFLVQRGKVLYRGYPSLISAELLSALAEKDADPVKLAERFPILRHGEIPEGAIEVAVNPWQPVQDATVQVMVGPSDGVGNGGLSRSYGSDGVSFATESITLAGIISAAWDTPPYRIEIDGALDDEVLHKVVFKAPRDRLDAARRFLTDSLGVRVAEQRRAVDGYRVSPEAGGHRLPEPIGTGSSSQTRTYPDGRVRITSPRMPLGSLLDVVGKRMGCPVVIADELAAIEFECDLTLPNDEPDRVIKIINERLGLVFTPERVEVTVLSVSPASSG